MIVDHNNELKKSPVLGSLTRPSQSLCLLLQPDNQDSKDINLDTLEINSQEETMINKLSTNVHTPRKIDYVFDDQTEMIMDKHV